MRATIPPQPFPPPVPPFPEQAVRVPPQPPVVYVAPVWEYKHVARTGSEAMLAEDELNALGAEGWELTAVVPDAAGVHFYFKRLRD